ncbi:S-adenosyl-L-methionine:benzoic acid/salicylic acid carboxyl methyltransferase 2 isoform X2 [Hevea brasiliensis]|nr:S-adenosyl-L-methionine:benzoic acid/salicylic acid carboxyl methyltransferase 2 isoform X2 [Hevea brasiliensis]XP_057994619.1 S-adenosyl-L-methionine:benzoic acid/salicylic acid carboxyl methyltransferase 2 isoform X2 [Hevea brasiliensis]XP_057994620.1 S-adenosyl-L-methionine:benzoic acid/salicylic acid carboxyl methyltransferase 2 isoform X2 [Hevea brasiliensis]
MTKPITEEAISNLYSSTYPKSLAIADLGCSSGPNTLSALSELIKVVDKLCGRLGRQSPEYQVFLNDLPGNDFNTIFRSLPGFQERMKKQLEDGTGPFFFTGVPGSFYGRLFPSNSLHFVHSSYSLHWLSQVPDGLEGNKGNIYMASGSPPRVLKAYYDQFQRDFTLFLTCRSEELVTGGRMVLTFLGGRSQDPTGKECCYIWELLAMALKEMVFEGIIEEEKLDSFNIPLYTPSPFEVQSDTEKEGSFSIDRLEVFEINWDAYHNEINLPDAFKDSGYNVARCMRAVAEPLLIEHFGFGEAIIDDVFRRYKAIIADRMGKEKTEFVNVVVAMTKKE